MTTTTTTTTKTETKNTPKALWDKAQKYRMTEFTVSAEAPEINRGSNSIQFECQDEAEAVAYAAARGLHCFKQTSEWHWIDGFWTHYDDNTKKWNCAEWHQDSWCCEVVG